MDRLFKLSFSPPSSSSIGLWACHSCGAWHDAIESWVQVGVGDDGRHAQIICQTCAAALAER